MSPARATIEQSIRSKWSSEPEQVAFVYLTKALSAHPELSAEDRQYLRDLLDAELLKSSDRASPVLAKASDHRSPPVRPPLGHDRIKAIAADAMHADTDGSEARFKILCQRAEGSLQRELESRNSGWWERFKLKRDLRNELGKHRAGMVWSNGRSCPDSREKNS